MHRRGSLAPRGYEDIVPKKPLIALYDAFYICGFILMGACIMTAWLAPSIKRGRTWFLFIFSWVLTSLANFMLLGQQTGPEPHSALCLIQSLFIYGAPVLSSVSGATFVLHIWLTIKSISESRHDMATRTVQFWFLAIPILCFMIMVLVVGIAGIVNPSLVERDATGMYCHLRVSYPAQILSAFVLPSMAIFLGFQIVVLVRLRRLRRISSQMKRFRDQTHMSIDLIIRFAIFGLLALTGVAISALNFFPIAFEADWYAKTNIVQAALPMMAGVIFGTQKDLVRVWTFRQHRNQTPSFGLTSTTSFSASK